MTTRYHDPFQANMNRAGAMNDEDHADRERHWRELAAQLGLDPGPEPGPISNTANPAPREDPHPVHARSERTRRPNPAPIEPQPHDSSEPAPAQAGDWLSEAPLEEPRHGHPGSQEAIAEPLGEERGRRGRSRRGGRTRRGRDEEPIIQDHPHLGDESLPAELPKEETGDIGPESIGEHSDKMGPERPGRKRSRRGRVPSAAPDPSVVEMPQEEANLPSAEAFPDSNEDDGDEVDTLSDWNAPSWNELVASLYRPPDR